MDWGGGGWGSAIGGVSLPSFSQKQAVLTGRVITMLMLLVVSHMLIRKEMGGSRPAVCSSWGGEVCFRSVGPGLIDAVQGRSCSVEATKGEGSSCKEPSVRRRQGRVWA